MKNLLIAAAGILLLFSGLFGCAPAIKLNSPDLPAAKSRIGSVAMGDINNLRPQNLGGQHLRIIGEVRSGLGSPLPLHAEEGRELGVIIRETAGKSLAHAGYYALSPAIPGDVPRLDIDVLNFWGDGYKSHQLESQFLVKLVNTGNGMVLAEREINLNRDFPVSAGYASLQRALDSLMKEFQQELVAFLLSEQFRAAVRGR
jgi:hypothetical protein